jgi:DNA-binding NtrC family response regulator/tetratricopeptide (TPR) repeat protein
MDARLLGALRGDSRRIVAIRNQVAQLLARQTGARRFPPLLILGETGTGKGLLARAIHQAGPRRGGPFVDVNCAAIPETLLEAEMFGYERGAFTDARHAKPGLFQTAHGGTLFLDEIGHLPAALQSKLLNVLEDRAVRRLGSTHAEAVDVALVAATSVDLKRAVREGHYREDLYHRLAVVTLELPPLRERGGDILTLAEHFLALSCADYGLAPRALTPNARSLLVGYRWPGNVRELANAMERVALLSDTDAITPDMLDFLTATDLHTGETPYAKDAGDIAVTGSLDHAVRARIEAALRVSGGNIRRTAVALGVSRNTLRARMDRYGLRHRRQGVMSRAGTRPEPLTTPEPAAPVQWERRHLAFLRARLLSSSTVEDARALEVIAEKVRSFGGRLEESGPTSVIGVFGLEPADNSPSYAALAALAIQKAMADARAAGGERPEVIVAIHCADHVMRRGQSSLQIGIDGKAATWSTLETLVGAGVPGAILASGPVVPFLTRRFVLDQLRGGAGSAWAVLRRSEVPVSEGYARFVGRTSELDTLLQASARVEGRHGQIVGVIGEAGVGKSRLLREAVRRLDGWLILSSGGVPYAQNRSYVPIVELIRSYCQIKDADTSSEVREKVAGALPTEADAAGRLLLPVLDLLGVLPPEDAFCQVDPQHRRQRTHEAVKHVILAASTAQPLCLIVEDLQWIDAETQAVLDLLAESIGAFRVLLLVDFRPEYQHGWGSRSAYTQVRLDPLPADRVKELLGACLGADPGLDALKRMLIERSEGNPFFLEETVQTLLETKALEGAQGAYRLTQPVQSLQIPATVHAMLAARIDRLAAEDKGLLQSAAVVGKAVPLGLLEAIADGDAEATRRALSRLQSAEFLCETSPYPQIEYTFKHSLTHEVAYESLLQDRRRGLHARIMAVIERQDANRATEQVDRLAHHAFCGEVWPKALTYLRQAGARAAARSAYGEAVACFEQALVAVAHLPESRETISQTIDIQLEMQGPLAALGQYQRFLDYLARAKDLALVLDDRSRLARALASECNFLRAALEFDRAIEVGERALTIATELGEHDVQVFARYGLGLTFFELGDLLHARDLLRWAVDALDSAGAAQRMGLGVGPTTILVRPRAWLTLTLGYLGQFAEGTLLGEETIRIAESGGHQLDCIFARYTLGSLYVVKGDPDHAIPELEHSLTLARTLGTVGWTTAGLLGQAYAQSGRYDDALRLLREALGISKQGKAEVRSSRLLQLGEIHLLAGHPAEAFAHARQALDLARGRKQRSLEALALRNLGEAASRRDRFQPAAAEECARQALVLASDLGMRPLVAQCHLDLGRLCRRTGRHEEAQEHLTTAKTMFREMEMGFWLEQTEAEMRGLA